MSAGRTGLIAAALLLVAAEATAGTADVVAVDIAAEAGGSYRVSVTIRSEETGWDKYADRWEVLGPDGEILAIRILHHPHVEEQPFTRSLGGVEVPAGIDQVTLRAHDSLDGYGGAEMTVPLPGR